MDAKQINRWRAFLARPTTLWAGSEDKIKLLASRAESELPLHVKGDCLHRVDVGAGAADGELQRRTTRGRPKCR